MSEGLVNAKGQSLPYGVRLFFNDDMDRAMPGNGEE